MNLQKLFLTVFLALAVILPGGNAPVKAGCVASNSQQAQATIRNNRLKTFGKLIRRVPGQPLTVELCGSGRGAYYKVKFLKSARSGNTRQVMTIPAR